MALSTPSLSHPDQQFIERLRAGDPTVWRAIYDSHRSKVVNYLRRRNASDEEAISVFHDTLVLLDKRKATLTLTSKLSVFLIGVAIRKLQERWKANKKNPEQLTDDFEQLDKRTLGDEDVDGTQLALFQLAFDDDDLLGMEAYTLDELLQKAMALLSEKCRTIFRMRYWDGLNDHQIAMAVPIEYHLVRNQFYKCKEKIKEILRDLGHK